MMNTCVRCGKQFETIHKTAVCQDCHTAVCAVCGKEFKLTYPYNQKTCSSKCRGIYRKQSGIGKAAAAKAHKTVKDNKTVSQYALKICKYCGKEFVPTSSNQKYCPGPHYGNCPVCGKQVEIKDLSIGPQACSKACRQARIKSTNLERYGVENVFQNDEIKQKSRDTLQSKYGVDHYAETQEYRDKYTATCLERYGVPIPTQNDTIKAKIRATNIERYGGPSTMCADAVKAKAAETAKKHYDGIGMASPILRKRIQATNLERYGASTALASAEVRLKCEQTMQERYGVSNSLQSPEIRERSKHTNMKRFGVEHPAQSPEIKEKVRQTFQEHYGVDNAFQSEAVKQTIAQTNLQKYGTENPMQNADIQEKAKQTCLQKYGAEFYATSKRRLERTMIDPSKFEQFDAFRQSPESYIRTNYEVAPTLTQLARDVGVDIATVSKYVCTYQVQHLVAYRKSTMEQDVIKFLHDLDSSIIVEQHNRKIIAPKEIDIYLPEYKLGIECNPTCTHNSSIKDPWDVRILPYNYHKNKSVQARDAGVFLLHIFGYEWAHRQPIILSMLSNLLQHSKNRVYARNTEIVELTHAECAEFLEHNHRQGSTAAKIRLGLRDTQSGELVSVMTFNHLRSSLGKRKTDADVWELSRFCNLINTSVVGGASKLFKYFVNTYRPDKVVSFSDIAHTRGTLYSQLGFTAVSESAPGYVWVNYSDDTYLSRVACQKNHLHRLFSDVDDVSQHTEAEIMEAHGYVRVYDSGVIRWEYIPQSL